MKKYKFYYKKDNNESIMVNIEADSYEEAVNIACAADMELDIDKTVMAFFKG